MELSLPPDTISPIFAVLVIVVSFFTSGISAAIGIGGGVAMLAVLSFGLPATSLIPIHGVIQLGSNTGRTFIQRAHINWKPVLQFSIGALFGGIAGGLLVQDLPDFWLKLTIGLFILFSVWGPKPNYPNHSAIFVITGTLSTLLTMFVGATGPFVAAVFKTRNLDRLETVASHTACMTLQHGIKIGIFIGLGFDFVPFIPLLLAMIGAGFLGTMVGTKLLHAFSEIRFRQMFNLVLTGMALLIIARSLFTLL